MNADCSIARSTPEHAAQLTAIAHAAKRHWGYPEDWIREWAPALTITANAIRQDPTYHISREARIVGFYSIRIAGETAELEHCWVLPDSMGFGCGRALFTHAIEIARIHGATKLSIISDPNAEGFYLRMGAISSGDHDAPVAGQRRRLPKLEKIL